jgi:hypothetical protein
MKGSTGLEKLTEADYRMSEILGDRYTESASEICPSDLQEMIAADWFKAYKRLVKRPTYTIPLWEVAALEETLANTYDTTQCIALALRLADLSSSADWFKNAASLAQSSTVGNLEQALYELTDRDEYVTVVLALVHYELFNSFELGEYVVKVEIIERCGKFYRKYINP